jgi:hypothetical protein
MKIIISSIVELGLNLLIRCVNRKRIIWSIFKDDFLHVDYFKLHNIFELCAVQQIFMLLKSAQLKLL